jgi:hypothetical protein
MKPMTASAPDDSDFTTTMNAKGEAVETRTFHSDKFITRVVRTWKTPNDRSISIYLKNGKAVTLPGDKWPDIKGQPVENFYAAAGLAPSSSIKNKAVTGKTKEKSEPSEKQ